MFIFVMDRAWVVVGEPVEDINNPDFVFLTLKRSGTVRRWGTSEGLGELAVKGPLEGTTIDKEPPNGQINRLDCKRIIPCNKKAWIEWSKKYDKWSVQYE